MIREAMRLPLMFGVSGIVHVAALAGLVLPPAPGASSGAPLQVRLVDGGPRRMTHSTPEPGATPGASLPHARRGAAQEVTPERQVVPEPAPQPATAPAAIPDSGSAPAESSPAPEAAPTFPIPFASAVSRASQPAERTPAAESAGGATATVEATGLPLLRARGVDAASAAEGGRVAPAAGSIAAPFPAPRAFHAPPPEYPEEARWERRAGRAVLGFRLEPDGAVAAVRLLQSSGHADLDAAALQSLRRWRFVLPPDSPPASWYRYVFRFELT